MNFVPSLLILLPAGILTKIDIRLDAVDTAI
jgi:hypothetical protein